MKRIPNKTERNETFASILNTTMKTSNIVTLVATLSLASLLNTSARAEFIIANSKHGATHQQSTTVDYSQFAKFEWLNSDDNQPTTDVNHIVVSLADQRLYAYHDQQLVAWSNVSSGKPGHETPTGAFTVSQKDVDHHSSLYDDASMPFFMRLTDGGVGLHAGILPGYPASHGCVRLPMGMARDLFQHVEEGTPVEIISDPVSTTMAQKTTTSANTSLAQG
jgi:lipoprotein-anchoring transpeptidase ErfK/SrfK